MHNIGDYVIYPLTIPKAGTYNISLNYKLSKSARGGCQWYVSEDNENYETIGSSFNQSTTSTEKMITVDLGAFTFKTIGKKYFKMVLNDSSTGTNLSTNYLSITLK